MPLGEGSPSGDGVAAASFGRPPDPAWVTSPNGYDIPIRRYGSRGSLRPIVMLHGLQSHSGWFVQSARRLADIGMPVYAFDRCGSGISKANSDVGFRVAGLLAEVDAVVEQVRVDTGRDAVNLVGHCFGAIVALLYAALHQPARVAKLVLATPALYTRTDLPIGDKARVLWSVLRGRSDRVAVPLAPEDFSELAPFVAFVRGDPLALRTVPARLMYEIARARRRLRAAARALRAPLFVAYAGGDVICDNRRTRRLLERVASPMQAHTYPGAQHILEFSVEREVFLRDLGAWLSSQEPR
jgi:alpha-beta hydrolase superfamily lysophospholipase